MAENAEVDDSDEEETTTPSQTIQIRNTDLPLLVLIYNWLEELGPSGASQVMVCVRVGAFIAFFNVYLTYR